MGLSFMTGYMLAQHGAQSARLAAAAGAGTGPSIEDLLDVHERVDRLLLVVGAMWSLLEENGYTAEQLKARVEEIDAADGVLDGKRTPAMGHCANCDAKVAPGLPACQFCGTAIPSNTEDPFSGV